MIALPGPILGLWTYIAGATPGALVGAEEPLGATRRTRAERSVILSLPKDLFAEPPALER